MNDPTPGRGGPAPAVACVILNWNGREDTLRCLESLAALDYPRDRIGILITDNASTDGSPEAIRERFRAMRDQGWMELSLIENSENRGVPPAYNVAVRGLRPDYAYVYRSDNDVLFSADAFRQLVARMEEDPGLGIAGPRVMSMIEPEHLSHGAGYVRPLLCGTRSVDARVPVECDFLTGCAMLIRRRLLGELDVFLGEAFFCYWEDTDLCRRVRDLGYRVLYVPDTSVYHRVSASSGSRASLSPVRTFYDLHGKLLYARRHLRPLPRLIFYLLFLVRVPWFLIRTSLQQPRGAGARLRAYLTALSAGLRGLPGRKYAG